jgi:hypothetical protein
MLRNYSSVLQIIIALALFFITAAALGCGGNSASAPISNDTPTDAYKRLFSAVKSKDMNAVKNEMSKQTVAFVESVSATRKQPVEKTYENGLTATTFSETLPPIRDERVNSNMGAVEVYNSKEQKWEDLPFVLEDGKWKFAVGDAFQGSYKSPGKGRDQKEREAANALTNRPSLAANITGNVAPPFPSNKPANNSGFPANK